MPFSIKKNDLFIEVSKFHYSGGETNPDRERNHKYENSMKAKNKLIEYALNNEFNYFITITFDKRKQDRYNYDLLLSRVRNWLNTYKYRHDKDLQYIIIPELHKKKSWEKKAALHIHGLIRLNTNKHLKFKTQRGDAFIYTHELITKAYGKMNEFTRIYNRTEFIAYYISKYVTKAIQDKMLTNHRYYASEGLKKNTTIIIEDFDIYGELPHYENQFCEKWKYTHDQFKALFPEQWESLTTSTVDKYKQQSEINKLW